MNGETVRTSTELKLDDAAAQMRLAIAHDQEDATFRSCINAYLATSRSVTMVMERESKDIDEKARSDSSLLEWYKDHSKALGAAPFFRFFNERRVFTIHRGVVEPVMKSWPIENVRLRSITDENGKPFTEGQWDVLSDMSPGDVGDVFTLMPDGTMTAWVFDDFAEVWPHHSGNVLSLCEMHFLTLKWMVQEWLRRREIILAISVSK